MSGLRFIRLQFGISGTEIGKRLSVVSEYVYLWEMGALIPKQKLDQLCYIFGLSPHYFRIISVDAIPEIKEKIAEISTEYRTLRKKHKDIFRSIVNANSEMTIAEEIVYAKKYIV